MFLGGPPLVKMAISKTWLVCSSINYDSGEVVDDETLGGAEMHSKTSGVSDYLAANEYHAIQLAREIVHSLNYKKATPLPKAHFEQIEEPYYDPGKNYNMCHTK